MKLIMTLEAETYEAGEDSLRSVSVTVDPENLRTELALSATLSDAYRQLLVASKAQGVDQ